MNLFYRIYQLVFRLAIQILPFPVPAVLRGKGSVASLAEVIKDDGFSKVFLVTDGGLVKLGLHTSLMEALEAQSIEVELFDEVSPNPTIESIESGVARYNDSGSQAIIGFGGGSPMDCAKVIAARVSNPSQSVVSMRGLFKIRKKTAPFYAVATTAGTGSETTIAAVVTNSETHEKFAVTSFKIAPKVAVLDEELTLGLPAHITAATGMDALTHAIEAYIGLHDIPFVKKKSEDSVKLIFANLEKAYKDGSDIEARANMLLGSFYGGAAFTRASVGMVHAIAHNMGGLYGVPHGLANAIILPFILDYSRPKCEKKLASLAKHAGLSKGGELNSDLAGRFIDEIKGMNERMGIPTFIKELKREDFPLIIKRALAEANPAYPVPRIVNRKDCEVILESLLPKV